MSRRKSHFRPASSALALEPRLLFDGAAAVAAVDGFDDGHDAQAEARKAEVRPAAEARPSEQAETNGGRSQPLLDFAGGAANHQGLLGDAARQAQQKLAEWLDRDDFRQQAAQIFSADAGSAEWNARLDSLRNEILNGSYSIRTEVRSSEALKEVLGAWSATGTTGE